MIDIVDFRLVATEKQSYDLGPVPIEVAYGANGFYVTKTLSGWVTFNNATFGDPIPRVVKAGYIRIKPATQRSVSFGGISDAGSINQVASLFREVGFDSIRAWLSFDSTGNVSDSSIAKLNSYAAAGITPRVVMTPQMGLSNTPPIPSLAIAKIIKTLDKRVRINLVNEANHGGYWPNNDWLGAFRWSDQVAAQLRIRGFACGSPSFTGWVTNWESWWQQVAAANLHRNFSFVVLHAYPSSPASNAAGWLTDFETMLATGRKIADRYGLKLDIDEWGFKATTPDVAAKLLPQARKLLDKYADASAYFIASKTGKQPHDSYAWMIDFATNSRREDLISAFKNSKP